MVFGSATVFQPPFGSAFVNSAIVAPSTAVPHTGRVWFVFKIVTFFMNLDEDKIYMKIAAFTRSITL
jgi:hypothetical protein